MGELRQKVFDWSQFDFFQHLTDPPLLLLFVLNAIDFHWLFQDALDIHEGRQGTVGVLLDIANVGAIAFPAFLVKGAEVFTEEVHRTLGNVVDPQDRLGQGTLAASAFPNNRNGLTFVKLKGHSVQRPHIAGLEEAHAAHFEPSMEILNPKNSLLLLLL